VVLKPFEVFICHKKSSGKDFADHLKSGLEELGYHTFLDSKDIPKTTDGKQEWIEIRDQALRDSKLFILLITPGFDLSQEVRKELKIARDLGGKKFLYFRHRDLGRKIIVDLDEEKVDLGRQEQVSFETKEELLRLAHGILLRESGLGSTIPLKIYAEEKAAIPARPLNSDQEIQPKSFLKCEMCSKSIKGQPYTITIENKQHKFDCKECAQTFKRFKSLYGDNFL
jgi:hypothetical protein